MRRNVKKEINKLYLYNVIVNFSMVSLIRNVYLQDEGGSLSQIGVMLSACFFGKVILEIPTGFIEDYYGNKVSLLGALLLQIVSLVIMVNFNTFGMMLVSFILLAIAYAMTTGCYDTILVEMVNEDSSISLTEVNSKNRFLSYASIGIASVLGGFVYQKSASYAFGIDVILLVVATILI